MQRRYIPNKQGWFENINRNDGGTLCFLVVNDEMKMELLLYGLVRGCEFVPPQWVLASGNMKFTRPLPP